MRKKYLIVNSILILVGIIISLIGLFVALNQNNELIKNISSFVGSLGSALITGGIVSLITTLIVTESDNKETNVDEWGLKTIYSKRSDMNINCDKDLEACKTNLDFIAFGLKNFRDAATSLITKKLQQGVKIRILTVNPQSKFLLQKSREEGTVPESISQSINELILWVNNLNKSSQNKIIIKIYDALPLFSYQRIDDHIYIGPNLYGLSSQKSISYEYHKGRGKEYFVDYFERLWNDNSFCKEV